MDAKLITRVRAAVALALGRIRNDEARIGTLRIKSLKADPRLNSFVIEIAGSINAPRNEEVLYDAFAPRQGLPPRGTKIDVDGSMHIVVGMTRQRQVVLHRSGKRFVVSPAFVRRSIR